MAVRVTFDQAKINRLTEAAKQALEMAAEATLSQIVSDGVVPFDVGTLERGGELEIKDKDAGGKRVVAYKSGYVDKAKREQGHAAVVFHTPYARRLYYHPEYNFRTDKNPNAQGKWMQSYLDGDKKDFIRDSFAKFFRKLSRGLIK